MNKISTLTIRVDSVEKDIGVMKEDIHHMATNCIPTINENMAQIKTDLAWITWFIKVVFWGIIGGVVLGLISINVAH